jgi:ATP-binding cassette, subfamily B, bacterial
VMTLPMEWHVDHHSGDTIDKIEKGTSALYSFAEDSFEAIYAVGQLVVCCIMLTIFGGFVSAGIVLVMIGISAIVTMRFDRVMVPQYKELNRAENNISESVFDAVSNITTVIILRVEKLVFSAIMRKVEAPFDLFVRNQRLNEWKWFLTNVCCGVMAALVLGVYFLRHIGTAQGVLVGSVYLLISYLNRVSEVFFRFTGMYSDIVKKQSRVMNSEELTQDFRTESFANHVLPRAWERLRVEGLNFAYNTRSGDLHLEDISISFGKGERVALVGESGSGKTTLLKIMRDLYHPRSLKLTVDERDIPDGFSGISRAIALVPQNPEIFATTILENITLGAEYDGDTIRKFTDMACFTDVVESLPKQFASSIKEKGVNLSGGQQQRLALARGLLACDEKDIVLLDEPTSSLDTATEMRVYRNIFREFREKTIISSIHRLHLLPLFEKIYLFHGGRIIAEGALEDLLEQSPEFRELWDQYHGYEGV